MTSISRAITGSMILGAAAPVIFADALPPAEPKAVESMDWGFIAAGCLFALAGALIFVWIGRRLFKR